MSEFIRYLGEIAVYSCNFIVSSISDPSLRLTAYIFMLVVIGLVFYFFFLLICKLFQFVATLFRRS